MKKEKNPKELFKILVVDDFATMRRIIRGILRKAGYDNVLEADNGETAIKIIQSQKIDLVLTDWNMPKMDGLTLLKNIKNNPDFKHIPVIMVTAESLKENIITAIKHGANNYIVKPFSASNLIQKIEKILN